MTLFSYYPLREHGYDLFQSGYLKLSKQNEYIAASIKDLVKNTFSSFHRLFIATFSKIGRSLKRFCNKENKEGEFYRGKGGAQ